MGQEQNIAKNWDDARDLISSWKEKDDTVVFTNGCFDIIHAGHIHYLKEARNLGDKLVIGLNSDSSVSRLKGPTRPINKQSQRAVVLAALKMVDLVVIFEESTPLSLIKLLVPNVLVKGGDWKVEDIVGADVVMNSGGMVKSLGFLEGFSTSSIIEKITNED